MALSTATPRPLAFRLPAASTLTFVALNALGVLAYLHPSSPRAPPRPTPAGSNTAPTRRSCSPPWPRSAWSSSSRS
jgi:hypothetical protein